MCVFCALDGVVMLDHFRALKTGGVEITRERWDEADPLREDANAEGGDEESNKEDGANGDDDEAFWTDPASDPRHKSSLGPTGTVRGLKGIVSKPTTQPGQQQAASAQQQLEDKMKAPRSVLPDWTRIPLPGGAPQAAKKEYSQPGEGQQHSVLREERRG